MSCMRSFAELRAAAVTPAVYFVRRPAQAQSASCFLRGHWTVVPPGSRSAMSYSDEVLLFSDLIQAGFARGKCSARPITSSV